MLEIRNLGVRYGRHIALDGVSAKIEKGEICVILGANGAGKSSLLKAVAGMVTALPGTEIVMNGKMITGMKPHKIVEEGIALVPEGRGIFGDLTVAENLQLGAFAQRARRDEAETLAQIYALFPRLAERKKQIARTMSGGEQQMVAIGRALMSKPDILMLDEPSLGLSPLLSKDLFKSLADVAKTGVGILLVEQNAKLSLKIAQRGYLIENGLITGEDTAAALMHDPAVVNAYLGGGANDAAKTKKRAGGRMAPAFAIPAAIEAISKLVDGLADRAGRIQSAFIRAMRRARPLPSAFEGRYDPASDIDPAEGIERTEPKPALVPQDAHALAQQAGDLASRAERRLAEHIASLRTRRTGATRAAPRHAQPTGEPHAQPPMPRIGEWPQRPSAADVAFDAEDLARRAEQRLRAHLAAQRKTVTLPAPALTTTQAPKLRAPDAAGASSSGIDEMVARAEQRLRAHRTSSAHPVATSEDVPAPAPTPHIERPSGAAGLDIDALVHGADRRLRETLAGRRSAATAETFGSSRAEPEPPRAADGDIEALARSAGERLRRHMDTNRAATLTARVKLFEPAERQGEDEPEPAEPSPADANGATSLVGHNSRGFEIDEQERPAARPVFDASDLAARAAAIQAAHVEARRKQKLDVFTLSPHRWS